MVSHRSFWRRSHDRSLHLIVAALVLWTVTFFAYRIATAVAVSDPVGEMIVRGNALLAVMPSEHPARLDLVDLVQQAQILGAPKSAPSAEVPPAASKPTNDQPETDDQPVTKSVSAKAAPDTWRKTLVPRGGTGDAGIEDHRPVAGSG